MSGPWFAPLKNRVGWGAGIKSFKSSYHVAAEAKGHLFSSLVSNRINFHGLRGLEQDTFVTLYSQCHF